MDCCSVGEEILKLRRLLTWDKAQVGDFFHATSDKQVIRDQVFDLICKGNFRVDATILEKSKAMPHVRADKHTFYKYAWYYHFKHIGPQIAHRATELHLNTASIGTKKGQAVFTNAVNDVVQQVVRGTRYVTTFTQSQCDPCLQVADYCTWAIQRKWERGDDRSYRIIQRVVATEFNLWRNGTKHYY
jgi:hypothetical protein